MPNFNENEPIPPVLSTDTLDCMYAALMRGFSDLQDLPGIKSILYGILSYYPDQIDQIFNTFRKNTCLFASECRRNNYPMDVDDIDNLQLVTASPVCLRLILEKLAADPLLVKLKEHEITIAGIKYSAIGHDSSRAHLLLNLLATISDENYNSVIVDKVLSMHTSFADLILDPNFHSNVKSETDENLALLNKYWDLFSFYIPNKTRALIASLLVFGENLEKTLELFAPLRIIPDIKKMAELDFNAVLLPALSEYQKICFEDFDAKKLVHKDKWKVDPRTFSVQKVYPENINYSMTDFDRTYNGACQSLHDQFVQYNINHPRLCLMTHYFNRTLVDASMLRLLSYINYYKVEASAKKNIPVYYIGGSAKPRYLDILGTDYVNLRVLRPGREPPFPLVANHPNIHVYNDERIFYSDMSKEIGSSICIFDGVTTHQLVNMDGSVPSPIEPDHRVTDKALAFLQLVKRFADVRDVNGVLKTTHGDLPMIILMSFSLFLTKNKEFFLEIFNVLSLHYDISTYGPKHYFSNGATVMFVKRAKMLLPPNRAYRKKSFNLLISQCFERLSFRLWILDQISCLRLPTSLLLNLISFGNALVPRSNILDPVKEGIKFSTTYDFLDVQAANKFIDAQHAYTKPAYKTARKKGQTSSAALGMSSGLAVRADNLKSVFSRVKSVGLGQLGLGLDSLGLKI